MNGPTGGRNQRTVPGAVPRQRPLPKRGDVLEVPENAYLYGAGPVRLEVEVVVAAEPTEWHIRGYEIMWNGDRIPRQFIVLPGHLPAPPRPSAAAPAKAQDGDQR